MIQKRATTVSNLHPDDAREDAGGGGGPHPPRLSSRSIRMDGAAIRQPTVVQLAEQVYPTQLEQSCERLTQHL